MSFVLKALKKLENEKADKKGGPSNIARDILQTNTLSRKRTNRVFPLVVLLFLVVAGLATFFLAGGLSSSPVEEMAQKPLPATPPIKPQEHAAPAPVEHPATEPVTLGSAPEPADSQTKSVVSEVAVVAPEVPAVIVEAPAPKPAPVAQAAENRGAVLETLGKKAQETVEKNRQTAEALNKTAKALQQTATALKEKVVVPKNSLPVVVREKAPQAAYANTDPVRTVSVTRAPVSSSARDSRTAAWAMAGIGDDTVPVLTVSEIHYRQDVRDRLAVVNELPVMEGMIIEGAKVDRIFKDRVRFVINGKYHELRLSQATRK